MSSRTAVRSMSDLFTCTRLPNQSARELCSLGTCYTIMAGPQAFLIMRNYSVSCFLGLARWPIKLATSYESPSTTTRVPCATTCYKRSSASKTPCPSATLLVVALSPYHRPSAVSSFFPSQIKNPTAPTLPAAPPSNYTSATPYHGLCRVELR